MPPVEIIAKRTANAKHFDNGNGTFVAEIHSKPIHHQKNGEWVDTDYSLHDLVSEIRSGEFPFPVTFVKASRALSITFPTGTITIGPRQPKTPTLVAEGGAYWLNGLWTGVDVRVSLSPGGVGLQYRVATATGQKNVAWNVTDPSGLFAANAVLTYTHPVTRIPTAVPTTYTGGIYTVNLATVPVGAVVA